MRVHRDPLNTRPVGETLGLLESGKTMTSSLVSRPRESYVNVSKRHRQGSSVRSHSNLISLRPANPQWMKTLEEKYQKLHLKIDSYTNRVDKTGNISANQSVSFMSHYSARHRCSKKPLGACDRPVDLVRLGKSVVRFAKKSSKSDYRSEFNRIGTSQQKITQKLTDEHRAPQTTSGNMRVSQTASEVINPVEQTHEDLSRQRSHDCNGSSSMTDPTPHVSITDDCDKQDPFRFASDIGVNNRVENIELEGRRSPVTDCRSQQHNPVHSNTDSSSSSGYEEDTIVYRETYARPRNTATFIDDIARPFSAQVSCFSHPSTHRSSCRPKSALSSNESASNTLHRETRQMSGKMARNGRKFTDRKRLNVLQGMSDEARFAITETKKEMDFQSNGVSSSDSAYLIGSTDSAMRRFRTMSEGITHKSRQRPPEPVDNCPEVSAETQTSVSCASVDTVIDDDSNNVNTTLASSAQEKHCDFHTKLPEIERNGRRQYNSIGTGKYTVLRSIPREKTFQITPPDYDVRFREILTCEIPESETPPPDIKAQAVAKCSEWLTKRYIYNSRSTMETFS